MDRTCAIKSGHVICQRRREGQERDRRHYESHWSNGQTEGQITKLKLVKRQMYGRAKIDLLEARLIGAG